MLRGPDEVPFTALLRDLKVEVLGNLLFRGNPQYLRNRKLRETRPRMRGLPEYCGRDYLANLPSAGFVAGLPAR